MAVKFLLDRALQEQQETIAKILEVVRKKPYPTIETSILGNFTHALLKVGSEKAKHSKDAGQKGKDKKEDDKVKVSHPEPHHAGATHMADVHFDGKSLPLPPPPIPPPELMKVMSSAPVNPVLPVPETATASIPEDFFKREYVIRAFDRPIGVLVDTVGDSGRIEYVAVEPMIDSSLVQAVKERIKSDFQRDHSVLDNDALLVSAIKSAAIKSGLRYNDDLLAAVRYYLKRDMLGFRRIEILMNDGRVKGIFCSGINKPILVSYDGIPGKIETNIIFHDARDLDILLSKLAYATGNELDSKKPILDTVYQGFRIQATKGIGGVSSRFIIEKVGFRHV